MQESSSAPSSERQTALRTLRRSKHEARLHRVQLSARLVLSVLGRGSETSLPGKALLADDRKLFELAKRGGFTLNLGGCQAIGLLYAPKTGDETRQQIREAAEQSQDAVKDSAQKAREQAGTWTDKGRDYLSSQKDQIRSAVDARREAHREATAEPDETAAINI